MTRNSPYEEDIRNLGLLKNRYVLSVEITGMQDRMIHSISILMHDGTKLHISGDCYSCLSFQKEEK